MNSQSLKVDCEIVGIDYEKLDSLTIKDVIQAFRKKALRVHPDKVDETHKEKANEEMKALNKSYERLLRYVIERSKKNKDVRESEVVIEVSEEEKFTEENFKNFNFPTENDGSFTVTIQHSHADAWYENLVNIYGPPTIHKSSKGIVGDTFWQFKYSVEEEETVITLHIYNKPKNKKSSKLMIQSGNMSLVCLYVFSELPRIYKNLCTYLATIEEEKKSQNLVECGQCKVKATMIGMKMHLKTAHSNNKSKKITKKTIKNTKNELVEFEFKCDNGDCQYKTNSREILKQHIEAAHLIPWKLRSQRSVSPEIIEVREDVEEEDILTDFAQVEERDCTITIPESLFICGECNFGMESETDIETHMINHHGNVTIEERIKYLEAALRAEKEQNKNRSDTLEETLNQVVNLEQKIKYLEEINSNQEAQIENLMKETEEKDKIITKAKKKHDDEVNELRKQQMLTSENLRSTVLEREVLRENDRILLNTFEMLKEHIDQMKEKFSKNNTVKEKALQKCRQCEFKANSDAELAEHMTELHVKQCFSCSKCKFKCESEADMKEHQTVELTNEQLFECDKCQSDSIITLNLMQI